MPEILDREKAAPEMFQLMPNGAFRSIAHHIFLSTSMHMCNSVLLHLSFVMWQVPGHSFDSRNGSIQPAHQNHELNPEGATEGHQGPCCHVC